MYSTAWIIAALFACYVTAVIFDILIHAVLGKGTMDENREFCHMAVIAAFAMALSISMIEEFSWRTTFGSEIYIIITVLTGLTVFSRSKKGVEAFDSVCECFFGALDNVLKKKQ